MDEYKRDDHLKRALAGLERYFFLIAFASYAAETDLKSHIQYSDWLQTRAELRNMVGRMRKPQHSTWVFGPLTDLSTLSKGAQLGVVTPLAHARFTDVLREGGELITDEFASQIVRRRRGITLRAGTILKVKNLADRKSHDRLTNLSHAERYMARLSRGTTRQHKSYSRRAQLP